MSYDMAAWLTAPMSGAMHTEDNMQTGKGGDSRLFSERAAARHREFIRRWAKPHVIPANATPCIDCEGTGEVDTAITPWHERIETCFICNGDGYLET
jgi:hypothetical protein